MLDNVFLLASELEAARSQMAFTLGFHIILAAIGVASWQTEVGGRFAAAFREVALQRVGAMTLPVNAYYAMFNINRALPRRAS
jgi:hypothetical protein